MKMKTAVALSDVCGVINNNVDWCDYMFKKHNKSIRRLAIFSAAVVLYFDVRMTNQNRKIDELSRQINELREEQEEE